MPILEALLIIESSSLLPMECQEADICPWVRVEKGSSVDPFQGLVLFRVIAKIGSCINWFRGLVTVLRRKRKGKSLIRSFRPLLSLVEKFWRERTAQLTASDRYLVSLC